MKYIIILYGVASVIQAFRMTIYFLRKDISLFRKIWETCILFLMTILCFFDLKYNVSAIYLSSIVLVYIIAMFIYERLSRNEYISVLSVKDAIDMADIGIMFLDSSGDVILINNVMSNILICLGINDNYIENLTNFSFRKIGNSYVIRVLNKIWQVDVNNDREIVLVDITELYSLGEEEEKQNKEIEENNKRIMATISNMEAIEKKKNLLKIKNEYHDVLGHRLALFTKYLEQGKREVKDIIFLLDSISNSFDFNLSSNEKLDHLIRLYYIVQINVNVTGTLPDGERGNILFEIIREAITNAIIHADSKNIDIVIKNTLKNMEMIITNDGKKPNNDIFENEGIVGMRRKLNEIGGSLVITTSDGFVLKVII